MEGDGARLCDCDGFWHVNINGKNYYVNEKDEAEIKSKYQKKGRLAALRQLQKSDAYKQEKGSLIRAEIAITAAELMQEIENES